MTPITLSSVGTAARREGGRKNRDLLFEQCFDIVEMTVTVQGAVHTELCGGDIGVFLDLLYKCRRERRQFGICRLCRGEAKLDGCTRLQHVTDHLERVVDCR